MTLDEARQEVEEARDFILALWNSIPQYNAYGQWPGGIVQGLFFKKGIFDLSPGIEWVTEQFGNRTVQRKVSFATTDANNADYTVFDYNVSATQPDDLIETAFASSSIPAAFPHITRGESQSPPIRWRKCCRGSKRCLQGQD